MPNAKEVKGAVQKKILVLGDTGNGKTSQILTLPGRKFVYIFDPNALNTLQGYDIDYEEYLPSPVAAAVRSLSKVVGGDRSVLTGSDVYKKFEETFNERLQSGFFNQYNWICFDSATTLLDLIMDRVLTINGRYGTWPHEDDYGPQMIAFTNLCRSITALGKSIYMTGHLEVRQNKLTKRVATQPMMTGRLVQKIPLLFSDVLVASAGLDEKGKPYYTIQTVPSEEIRTVRCSIKGLEPIENVTIDWSKDPEGQGLGGILNWEMRTAKGA